MKLLKWTAGLVVVVVLAGILLLPGQIRKSTFPIEALEATEPAPGFVAQEVAGTLGLTSDWPVTEAATILFFHRNNVTAAAASLELTALKGYRVLIAEYPGYGGDGAEPSETSLVAAARAWAGEARNQAKGPVLLFGNSVGGALAAMLAAEGLGDGLVTAGAPTRLTDLAPAPLRPLFRDRFDAVSVAGGIEVPWVLFHCQDDPEVPAALGRALAAARGEGVEAMVPACSSHSLADMPVRDIIDAISQKISG
ncbi:MAG: alpha/beta fold hydrolase [Paracoccaceae bacterium]